MIDGSPAQSFPMPVPLMSQPSLIGVPVSHRPYSCMRFPLFVSASGRRTWEVSSLRVSERSRSRPKPELEKHDFLFLEILEHVRIILQLRHFAECRQLARSLVQRETSGLKRIFVPAVQPERTGIRLHPFPPRGNYASSKAGPTVY